MYKNLVQAKHLARVATLLILGSAGTLLSTLTGADEGGAGFWLPGQNGSLVAVPGDPGWSIPIIYYHSSVDAGGSAEIPRRRLP